MLGGVGSSQYSDLDGDVPGISKENLYLYCAQYNFLRNMRKEDRARRAASIAISALANIEEEPCTVSVI